MLPRRSESCKNKSCATNSKPNKPNRKGRRMSKKQRKGRLKMQDRAFQAHLLDLQDKARKLERARMSALVREAEAQIPMRFWPA